MVRCDQPDQPAYEAGGYQWAVTLSKARNGVIARIWQKEKTGCLTFIRELDHGRYLLRIAQHLGIRAEFVNGEMDAGPIDKAITRFERGEIDVLIASDVLKQGADTIHVYSGINAAGRKSVIETIQRRGRAGRICREANCARCAVMGKKSTATWYDLYDTDSWAEKMWNERRRKLPGHSAQNVTLAPRFSPHASSSAHLPTRPAHFEAVFSIRGTLFNLQCIRMQCIPNSLTAPLSLDHLYPSGRQTSRFFWFQEFPPTLTFPRIETMAQTCSPSQKIRAT
jgi:superfamily II DNA or RNA helicase